MKEQTDQVTWKIVSVAIVNVLKACKPHNAVSQICWWGMITPNMSARVGEKNMKYF